MRYLILITAAIMLTGCSSENDQNAQKTNNTHPLPSNPIIENPQPIIDETHQDPHTELVGVYTLIGGKVLDHGKLTNYGPPNTLGTLTVSKNRDVTVNIAFQFGQALEEKDVLPDTDYKWFGDTLEVKGQRYSFKYTRPNILVTSQTRGDWKSIDRWLKE